MGSLGTVCFCQVLTARSLPAGILIRRRRHPGHLLLSKRWFFMATVRSPPFHHA
jgi:hypothetical protein